MKSEKIEQFMKLAGQSYSQTFVAGDEKERELGAQLLLSEVLEYVIHGLGVTPTVGNVAIKDPNGIDYKCIENAVPNKKEMLDGLADVAYTMFWNQVKFGIPLEEAFELVCDNNLAKFVALNNWSGPVGNLPETEWSLDRDVSWPESVATVEVVKLPKGYFAVGKDKTGKVRKPSTYVSVDLDPILNRAEC